LTFVTPTLLAGDRSLADVVAHEAAHSWSGNLVTNETWEHFWLNEGWTVFLQRKIMARVHNDTKFFDFDAIGGWKDLKDSVDEMPEGYTKLIPDLGDGDPDDAFSSIPYEKGFNLLYSLERLVGEEKFGGFVKAYFNEFKFGVITSEKFKTFFESYFKNDPVDVSSFDWETWLTKPGMPVETPNFDRTLSSECEELAQTWMAVDNDTTGGGGTKAVVKDISNWSTAQTTTFLDALTNLCHDRGSPLSLSTIQAMKDEYNFASSKNSEVLHRFCMLAVESGDTEIIPIVIRFITTQGRMKFVRPLYRALYKSDMGKTIAVQTFLANREFYHPICAKMVATDLCLAKTNEDVSSSKKKKISLLAVGAAVVLAAAVGMALRRGKR
jgi:leukotriene-A4 hydrolase